jgi:uncharacterized membrane protein YkoI
MRCITWLGAGSTLALLILAVAASADGERVRLNMIPLPVLDAVRARFKDARLTGADKEVQDGKAIYEIAIKHEGRNIDVTLTPEGAILLIKREIAAKDLPARVSKALEGTYPRATYKELEEVTTVQGHQEKLAYYEVVLVTAQKKTVEVKVSAEGEIVK